MTLRGPILAAVRLLPTGITLAALICGMLSLYASLLSLDGATPVRDNHAAALLIMLAMILDGLDGNVARLLKAESAIGGELDTFVDLTAFGIAPALLLYTAAGFSPGLRIALGCGLVASGAYRLARFKVIDPFHGQRGYVGLPITVCAAMVALFHILSVQAPDSWGVLKVNLREGPFAAVFLAIVVLLAVLQVSRIHFTKPSTSPLFFIPAISLVALLLSGVPALAAGGAVAGLLFGLFYVCAAPFLKRAPTA